MTNFIDTLKNRRSIYQIGNNVDLSQTEIEGLIKEAIKESPSSFNSQSSRAVILFGEANAKVWDIVLNALKPLTPAEAFEGTKAKIASFAAGKGTVLFFEDQDVIKGLQENFALYADNFPVWSEQSTGIAQHSVWVALSEKGIGATLQHYNPIIDEEVAAAFDIPANWKLRAQMPFGSIEGAAGEKEYMADEDRFKVIG